MKERTEQVLARALELHAEGQTYQTIAERLTAEGFLSAQGKPLKMYTVRWMIWNSRKASGLTVKRTKAIKRIKDAPKMETIEVPTAPGKSSQHSVILVIGNPDEVCEVIQRMRR